MPPSKSPAPDKMTVCFINTQYDIRMTKEQA